MSEAATKLSVPAEPVQLHPQAMEITGNGVTPFCWPLPIGELGRARDRFQTALFSWVRGEGIGRSRDAELVWLNAAQITVEFLRLFNGAVVQLRLARLGRFGPRTEAPATLFDAFASGDVPGLTEVTWRTLDGLKTDPAWRKALRAAKHALGGEVLTYRPKALIRPDRDIVTFSGGELVLAHAQSIGRPVVLSKLDEWMTPGDLSDRALPAGLGRSALDALHDMTEQAFAEAGEAQPAQYRPAFENFIDRMVRRAAYHLGELERTPKELPKVFWSGTGGILYNRVMARAVDKAGGLTVGHDHGTGTGWWRSSYQTLSELNYVQRFVTYSEAMAAGLRRNQEPELTAYPDRPCEISAVPLETSPPGRPTTTNRDLSRTTIKTVMYVPTIYTGDSMYLLPLLADPVAVDWQARLFAFLRDQRYDITIKPHPESYCPPPPAFADFFGVRSVEGPFEQVMQGADLIIFDYLQTSCIVSAVRSDRPIVIVEFPRLSLDPEARALLARRCALVQGRFDEDGRAQVGWPDLAEAIEAAPGLMDRRFAELYYPRA